MDEQELQQILNGMSEQDLAALANLASKISNKTHKRKRGKGKRKRKNNSQPASTTKQPSFLNDITLSPEEQKELNEAARFDKKKGLDKPKIDGTMIQGNKFKKASIKCMSCNKTFEISPALIPPERDRYKCNSCICRGRNR